jgi:hypothetical protein
MTLGAAAFAVAMLAITGFIDARAPFPISRRQYIQLAVIVIASIPMYVVPPLAYLMTYWTGGSGSRSSRGEVDEWHDA